MAKQLLKVSTNLRGKMTGMTVITSACTNNPHCEKLAKIDGAICQHCYAQRSLSYMRGPREAYVKNGILLSSGIIPKEELPYVNARRELLRNPQGSEELDDYLLQPHGQ